MKLVAFLSAFVWLASIPALAQEKEGGCLMNDTVYRAEDDDSAKTDAGENTKEAKREAAQWLKEELKDRMHVLALLKKVKDAKSADKVGATLKKEYGDKVAKKTAMGDAEPPKRPTGPVMEECEKKYTPKFRKLDADISEQLKRIEELELDSADLKEGLQVMPKYAAAPAAES